MDQKRRTIKHTFLRCDYYTWLIIFFPLITFNLMFLVSEVASELLFKDSGSFLKSF